jgi:hypothetical protein
MPHPCKAHVEAIVTYCWNDVDIAVSIKRYWVHQQYRKSCEVVLAEPFRPRNREFSRYTKLSRS